MFPFEQIMQRLSKFYWKMEQIQTHTIKNSRTAHWVLLFCTVSRKFQNNCLLCMLQKFMYKILEWSFRLFRAIGRGDNWPVNSKWRRCKTIMKKFIFMNFYKKILLCESYFRWIKRIQEDKHHFMKLSSEVFKHDFWAHWFWCNR